MTYISDFAPEKFSKFIYFVDLLAVSYEIEFLHLRIWHKVRSLRKLSH